MEGGGPNVKEVTPINFRTELANNPLSQRENDLYLLMLKLKANSLLLAINAYICEWLPCS